MRTMICEGGRAAPQGRQKAPAVVNVFVLPGPVDGSGSKRTPDFFVAVGADPSNHTQVWMGIPGGIMTITSHCSRTATEALFLHLSAMGWAPTPGTGGKLSVQQAVGRPYAPKDLPGQQFLQYLLDLQSGMMRAEELPTWMAVTGRSAKVYRPCGAVVGPRGPAVGGPCPTGPCQLNQGGGCVWKTHSGKEAAAPPTDPTWRQQAAVASQAPAVPVSNGHAPPSYRYVPPADPSVVHPPGGEFVMDMSPDLSTEFAKEEPPAPAKDPAKKRAVKRKRKSPAKPRNAKPKAAPSS